MKYSLSITAILMAILWIPVCVEAQQRNDTSNARISNAEPIHSYFVLTEERTIPIVFQQPEQKKAMFHHKFQFQSCWKGKQVILRLDQINLPFSLKINEFPFGSGEGLGIPVEFNLTPLLKQDKNLLELNYEKSPDNLTVNHMGALLIRDPVHVRDLQVTQYYQTGVSKTLVRIHLFIQSFLTEKNKGRTLTMVISDPLGETIVSKKQELDFPLAFRQEMELSFDCTIEEPLLWSPKHPNLYSVQIGLVEKGQLHEEVVSTTFGIRNFNFSDSLFVFNHDTIMPRIVDQPWLVQLYGQSDSEILTYFEKQGYNAVRPNQPLPVRLKNLFDLHGIMVLKKKNTLDPVLDIPDRNRPSIVWLE